MPGLEDLKKTNEADLKANMASLKGLNDPADIVAHLKNTLWPFLESLSTNVLDEMLDLEATVLEVAQSEGDMLSEETAGVFANVLLISVKLAGALKARLTPTTEDRELDTQVDAFLELCGQASQVLAEITIPDDEEEDPDAATD